MEKNRKNRLLPIYYIGIIAGSVLFNYLFRYHSSFTEELYGLFQNLDKLSYVEGKELFFYLLIKRWKQALLAVIVYYNISEKIVQWGIAVCFPVLAGAMISFFFFYAGFTGVVYVSIIMLPLGCLCYLLFRFINNLEERKKLFPKWSLGKELFLLTGILILEVFIEIIMYVFLSNINFFNR